MGLITFPLSSYPLYTMDPVVMQARAMVGFKPAPESGPAMRTTTYTAIAHVKFESIPSDVALTLLYFTESTIDTRIIVKNASTSKRYMR